MSMEEIKGKEIPMPKTKHPKSSSATPKKFLCIVGRGMGRNLVGTGVIKRLADQHPGAVIDVMASYPDMFRILPFVHRTYAPDEFHSYFRDEHADFEILSQDPYTRLAFRNGDEHLSQAWARAWGIEPPSMPEPGIIKFFQKEHEAAMAIIGQLDRSKPWIAFQPFGGTSYTAPEAAQDIMRPRQVRDIPADIAQAIVDRLTDAGCKVIQFSLPTERRLEKPVFFDLGKDQRTGRPAVVPPRVLFALLNLCQGFIGIDSSMMHAWAAMQKAGPAVVLWGGSRKSNFGYQEHVNIELDDPCPTPRCGRPDLGIPDTVDGGQPWECPHEAKCMLHNPEKIVEALLSRMKPDRPGK